VNKLPRSALDLRDALAADRAGGRHIGMLVPWANRVIEAELPRLSPDRLVWHYARLAPSDGRTALDDGFLAGLHAAIPGAVRQLSRVPLDMLQLGCTSLGFSYLINKDDHAGPVQLVDAFGAIGASLRLLEARRVALLTPYPLHIMQREVEALNAAGMRVVATGGLDQLDDYADIPSTSVMSLVAQLTTDELQSADVIILSCTGWPTRVLLADIEATTRRPALSSNLAMIIAALAL
jgi:maleate isomerase